MSAAFKVPAAPPDALRYVRAIADRLSFHRHDAGELAAAINLEDDRLRRARSAGLDFYVAEFAAGYLDGKRRSLEAQIRARLSLSSNVVALRA